MSLPSYFKQVKEEVLEAEDPIKRVANPFNDVTYEVVVNKKGVVTGDPMDYVARKMTAQRGLWHLPNGGVFKDESIEQAKNNLKVDEDFSLGVLGLDSNMTAVAHYSDPSDTSKQDKSRH